MVGKLERMPLWEVWKHAANDFTSWLEENIEELGEALDLDLSSGERDQNTGAFSADLVAENEGEAPRSRLRYLWLSSRCRRQGLNLHGPRPPGF